MIWKKTWFSYGVWGLYSAVVSMAFALGIMLFVPKGSNPYLAVLLVCLFFLLMTLFFFLSQTIVVNVGGKRKIKRKAAVLVETFAILAALAGGSVLSVGFLRQAQPETLEMKETEMFVEGYKAALVKDTSFKGLWKVSFTLRGF